MAPRPAWKGYLKLSLVTCAVVWLGVHRVWAGHLSAGDLLVFSYYVKNLYGPLRDLAKQGGKIAKGKVGLERVLELLEEKPSVADALQGIRAGFAVTLMSNQGPIREGCRERRPAVPED